MELDFDSLLEHIDATVIELTSLFSKQQFKNINEAKMYIKDVYVNNDELYFDYKNHSYRFIESMLSEQRENNFQNFHQIFFSVTFLLQPLLMVSTDDEEMIKLISDHICKLYLQFSN